MVLAAADAEVVSIPMRVRTRMIETGVGSDARCRPGGGLLFGAGEPV